MRVDDLDYRLPPELVAQQPAARREDARLLVVDRATGALADRQVVDLPSLLAPDDLVVVNDSRVRRARLSGRLLVDGEPVPGRAVELLVLEPVDGHAGWWRCLAAPARRLGAGRVVRLDDEAQTEVTVVGGEGGGVVVVAEPVPGAIEAACLAVGAAPLPPYVRVPEAVDAERYQTVYAARTGSAAAPTAGLHLGDELWPALRARAEVVAVTLDVGLGTFARVRVDDLADHAMHAERYEVAPPVAATIRRAAGGGRRIVCVGTTSVRVVETLARGGAAAGRTALRLDPDNPARWVGALLTNFHEPRSTLIALVMAFAGPDLVRRAYAHAVAQRYRFLSLGDASFWS